MTRSRLHPLPTAAALAAALALVAALAPAAGAAGLPRKAGLGAAVAPVPDSLAHAAGLAPGEGVLIRQPLPGSTAAKAGLEPGDVLERVNDAPARLPTLAATFAAMPVGQAVTLRVRRNGREHELKGRVFEKPREPANDAYYVDYLDVTSNGHRMRTIVTHPRTPGRHPGFFFIQGYSPISYDYFLDTPGLDAPILRAMARAGFVTLRVEKPGVGDSEGGPFADVDFTTETDIYRQALRQLRSLPDVDTRNVFVFGHSMGGAFGPVIACEIPVRGMILYGVEARTWHEYLLDTVRYQELLAGRTYAGVDADVRAQGRVMEMVFEDHETPADVRTAHPELAATADTLFPGGLFNGRTSAFWSQLENTNFAAYWERCNTHVLAVHGASDFVSYAVDHQLIADIVNRVHPGWGRFDTEPASDHLFNNWATEAESLQHWPLGTFNPAFIERLQTWIADVMKSGN